MMLRRLPSGAAYGCEILRRRQDRKEDRQERLVGGRDQAVFLSGRIRI